MNAVAPVAAAFPLIRKAHVIVVGNEKGGAGKSTIAMHLAVALLRQGKGVALLDLDLRQRTLSRYVENRQAWALRAGLDSPMPHLAELAPSNAPLRADAAREDGERLAQVLAELRGAFDYVVADAPGADTPLSRHAHASADTLVTPLNDSFVDFDLLAAIDPVSLEIGRPSLYAEMVWESRKRKALAERGRLDWVVLRNRVSPSRIEAKNKQRVGAALESLAGRIGCRLAPGFSERVAFRDLFPHGLTLLDVADAQGGVPLNMGYVAARQELRDLLGALNLPGLGAFRA